jgi:hypothetical protein
LIVAARAIFDSQRFDVVVPLHRNIPIILVNCLLDTSAINQICNDFKVDAVLVLEFSEKYGSFHLPWRRIIRQLVIIIHPEFYQPGPASGIKSKVSRRPVLGRTDNSHRGSSAPLDKGLLITGGLFQGWIL